MQWRSLHRIQESAYKSLVKRSQKKNDQRQSSGSMSILLPSQAGKPDLGMRLDRLDAVSFTDDNLHALSSELTRIVEYYDIQSTYNCSCECLKCLRSKRVELGIRTVCAPVFTPRVQQLYIRILGQVPNSRTCRC